MFFSKKSRPKKMRYRVVVKGITVSKHSTLKLATTKAKSIRTARVVKIGSATKKRTYRARRY
jgi:hypothetical protein